MVNFTKRMRQAGGVALLTVAGFIGGCGGGGGEGSAPPAPLVAPLSTTDRQTQAGDAFTYRGKGLYQRSGGHFLDLPNSATLDATGEVTVSNTAFDDRPALEEFTRLTFTHPNLDFPISVLVSDYFTRDANGKRVNLGYTANSSLHRIRNQSYSNAIVYEPGSTATITTRFVDGGSEKRTFTVEESETVTVPAGRFAVWRCVRVDGDGEAAVRSVLWIAPDIGVIKRRQTERTDDGTFVFTLELAEYHLS